MEPEGSLPFNKGPPLVPILRQMHSVHTFYPISLRSIVILPSHLHFGLPNNLFPSGFSIKTLYASHLSHEEMLVPKCIQSKFNERFPVFTAVKIRILGFDTVQSWGRIPTFQGSIMPPWRWKQHGPPKRWYPTTIPQSVTTQKKTSTWK